MELIERSGHGNGDWLGHAAQLMKEEIIDRIADGELLGWPGDVLEKLTNAELMSITEAAEFLRESRLHPNSSASGDDARVHAKTGSEDMRQESDGSMD